MNNTMNAKPKGYCDVDHKTGNVATKLASTAWTQRRWYNNRVDCETEGFVWYVDQDYQDWCIFSVSLEGYCSVLLVSHAIWSGALDNHYLLLSHPTTTLAYNMASYSHLPSFKHKHLSA